LKRRYFLFACLLIFLTRESTLASDVLDIRTGQHSNFTRIVVEFSGPVRYQVIPNKINPSVIIDALNVSGIRDLRDVSVDSDDPILRQVRFIRKGNLLSITAYLKSGSFEIKQHTIYRPFRIVLDIFSSQSKSVAIFEKPKKKISGEKEIVFESITEPPVAAKIDSIVSKETQIPANIPAEVLKHTELQTEADLKPSGNKETAKTESASDSKKIFWIIGSVFVLLDIALLALYLNSSKRKKRLAKVENQFKQNYQEIESFTERVEENQLDQRSQKFVELLKQAMENEDKKETAVNEQEVSVAEDLEEAAVDSTVLELPETVEETPRTPQPEPPELVEIIKDLYPDIPEEELTEASARAQLIGRDGVEFMKNIKRLYLN